MKVDTTALIDCKGYKNSPIFRNLFFIHIWKFIDQIIFWEQIKIVWSINSKYVLFLTKEKNQMFFKICAVTNF